MTNSPWPAGLLTALVTPLLDDEIGLAALKPLVDRQIEAGVAGLVVAGGTGEFGALTVQERQLLTTEAVAAIGGRVPVVVQTGALTTRDVVTLSRHAQEAGATNLMVASPFGETINWAERTRFYETVSAAVSIPIMVYNTPSAGLLTLARIQELCELPNITAVKDSSGSPELMGDLVEWAAGSGAAVYVGLDSLMYDAFGVGARGAVFGAANVIPEPLVAVARSLQANGQNEQARALWKHIRTFLRFMEVSPNYMSLCKSGLNLQGLLVGEVRAPYLMSGEDEVKELARRLGELREAFSASPLSEGFAPLPAVGLSPVR
jgi:4-hydroxy-tetrahydrodipicolinate synthase